MHLNDLSTAEKDALWQYASTLEANINADLAAANLTARVTVLRSVLVGSWAAGTADANSDFDLVSALAEPTIYQHTEYPQAKNIINKWLGVVGQRPHAALNRGIDNSGFRAWVNLVDLKNPDGTWLNTPWGIDADGTVYQRKADFDARIQQQLAALNPE